MMRNDRTADPQVADVIPGREAGIVICEPRTKVYERAVSANDDGDDLARRGPQNLCRVFPMVSRLTVHPEQDVSRLESCGCSR